MDPALLEVVRKRKESGFSALPDPGLGQGTAAAVMGMLQGLGGSPLGVPMGMMSGLGGLPVGGLGGMLGASADPSTKALREIHFGNMPPLVSHEAATVLAYSSLCSRHPVACLSIVRAAPDGATRWRRLAWAAALGPGQALLLRSRFLRACAVTLSVSRLSVLIYHYSFISGLSGVGVGRRRRSTSLRPG